MWEGTTAVQALQATDRNGRGVYSQDYVNKSAENLIGHFIIETVAGVTNIEAILDSGQPDLVSFGWGDFSVEVEFDLDRCRAGAQAVYDACRRRGIGVSVSTGQAGPTAAYPGCISIIGIDSLLINAALESAVDGARRTLSVAGEEESGVVKR
jgi:2-keto-3-deoxy-L-rhamnonate aldolase RhmA